MGYKKYFKFEWDSEEDTSERLTKIPVKDRFRELKNETKFLHNTKAYDPSSTATDMTPRDWTIFREDNDIKIISYGHYTFKNFPNPCRSWTESKLPKVIIDILKISSFDAPRPIQMQVIPLLTSMTSTIGISKTGSGKTLAYVIPIILRIFQLKNMTKIYNINALILVPTRDLALQIFKIFEIFTKKLGFLSKVLIGGHSIHEQLIDLSNTDILVATPGRFRDCFEYGAINLDFLDFLIIDEFDRMFELNFEEDIMYILREVPDKTTFGFFSATYPKSIKDVLKKMFKKTVIIRIGLDSYLNTNSNISQIVIHYSESTTKLQKLINLLRKTILNDLCIIFVDTKKSAESLSKSLILHNINTYEFHSGLSQERREKVLQNFILEKNDFNVLISTDIASRGLDIPNVKFVINYTMPYTLDIFIHRIGRTGRSSQQGTAITFVSPDDLLSESCKQIISFLKDSKHEYLNDFQEATSFILN